MQAILSREILSVTRSRVAEALPKVKRAHLAEVLAYCLGHRTNASLVAWLATCPVARLAIAEVDAARASVRIAELGYGLDPRNALIEGLKRAGALVNGPGYRDLSPRVAGDEDFVRLSHPMRFAFMARQLLELAGASGGMADFVEAGASVGVPDVHLRLAASLQLKRDFDRDIADFLVEFLLEAEAEQPFDDASRSLLAWGDQIFRAYRPRIEVFLDAACRTWCDEVDPLALEPLPQLFRRLGRQTVLIEGRSNREHEIGFRDTGHDFLNSDVLIGACCLAKLKAGAAKADIADFVLKARNANTGVADYCLSQVAFVSAGGMGAAKARITDLIAQTAALGISGERA